MFFVHNSEHSDSNLYELKELQVQEKKRTTQRIEVRKKEGKNTALKLFFFLFLFLFISFFPAATRFSREKSDCVKIDTTYILFQ